MRGVAFFLTQCRERHREEHEQSACDHRSQQTEQTETREELHDLLTRREAGSDEYTDECARNPEHLLVAGHVVSLCDGPQRYGRAGLPKRAGSTVSALTPWSVSEGGRGWSSSRHAASSDAPAAVCMP